MKKLYLMISNSIDWSVRVAAIGYVVRARVILVLLMAWCSLPLYAATNDDPRTKASFYINTYGLVDTSTSPLAQRAHEIFKRIRQVAEDPVGMNPTLKIINSKGKPWAIALPDGYIILSKAALDVCYHKVDKQVGDARLAFVLGHEIAHLTTKDFWHQQIFLSLSSGQKTNIDLENIRVAFNIDDNEKLENWRDVVRKKELHADDKGFTYASLANYRTDYLFANTRGREDFLATWVKQTRNINDDLHFNANDRSAFLLNRFTQMTSKMEYFMSGVRLSHFGQFEDAMHFFEKFQHAFPAHEVLNNMGFVQIQLARKLMSSTLRYQYWLPIFMENIPSLAIRTRTMDGGLSPRSRRHLENAVAYLQKSARMHSGSLSSRINISVAYLYLGRFHKARASIEEARDLDSGSPVVNELRAIIIYEQEKDIDMWPTAIKILKTTPGANSPSRLFNLAKLYDERGRFDQAKSYWKKLAKLKQRIPKPIFLIACNKVRSIKNCDRGYGSQYLKPPFKTRLKPGEKLNSTKAKKMLVQWRHRYEDVGPLLVDLYVSKNSDIYLAIEKKVAMVVVKKHAHKSIKNLLRCCGEPTSKQDLGQSELWSYGTTWTALVTDNKVREYWINGN